MQHTVSYYHHQVIPKYHNEEKARQSDLSKLAQHAHKLVFIDDSPVGALALEGDHPWHRAASSRWRQVCALCKRSRKYSAEDDVSRCGH